MSFVAGNAIVDFWEALDWNSAPITGLDSPTDFVMNMIRELGTTGVAATEVITLVEIGVTGRYAISFTPVNAGLYKLYFREQAGAVRLRTWTYSFEVVSAGSVFAPAFANAYCAETDIERWIQQSITSTTKPSSNESAGFAEARGAVLSSLCAGLNFAVTPSTVIAGSRLEDILREANAIGASLDYTIAAVFSRGPSKTERIDSLGKKWKEYYGNPALPRNNQGRGIIEMEITNNLAPLATDHVQSGDTQPRTPEEVVNEDIQIGMDDIF